MDREEVVYKNYKAMEAVEEEILAKYSHLPYDEVKEDPEYQALRRTLDALRVEYNALCDLYGDEYMRKEDARIYLRENSS